MRKVFLENLPRWESGRYKGNINWKESVGHKVKFIYDDIEGEIEITEYLKKGRGLYVKYNDKIYDVNVEAIRNCKLGKITGIYTNEFKLSINDEVLDEKRNITIVDREYRKINTGQNFKYYKYKCNKCGNEDWMLESHLITGKKGCNACCNPPQKAKLGINTIWDTDRWMIDLGISEEDGKRYTSGSGTKIKVICPNCLTIKTKTINDIHKTKSIGCTCGDGKSYPEKFIFSMFKQLDIEFETEYSPTWINNRRYDFYIPSKNTTIEVHGIQHYKETKRKGSRTLKQEQDNDNIKKELAKENGIKNYIVIDARESDIEFIKNNILDSGLVNLFDLSKIDWNKCDEFALSNRVKEVCDYWNNKNEWESTTDLAIVFKMGRNVITRHLKKGANIGWCKYDVEEEKAKRASRYRQHKGYTFEYKN